MHPEPQQPSNVHVMENYRHLTRKVVFLNPCERTDGQSMVSKLNTIKFMGHSSEANTNEQYNIHELISIQKIIQHTQFPWQIY